MDKKIGDPMPGPPPNSRNATKTNTAIPGRQAGGAWAPSGQLWPNGEFSVGYAHAAGGERLKSAAELADEWFDSLGLSLDSNSHTPLDNGKAKRGTKGLTSHGKRVLRNAITKLQDKFGKGRLSFVTLTLPAITYEESWYVSSCWSEICRVFYQKLGRRLESLGLPAHYAGCTELQPDRSEREGHPALHLHFVCVGRKSTRNDWALRPSEFREMWRDVVQIYVAKGYDWSACENVVQVKKDAAAYLSKYASKGISMDVPPRSDETGWSLPTCWYNVSLKLRRWVLDNIRTHPELIDMLERVVVSRDFEGGFEYVYSGSIEEMPGPGPHYHVGKLTPEFMGELIDIWRASVLDGVC